MAAKHDVTREAQDAFALRSHERAIAAIDSGAFDAELVPVTVHGKKGPETVSVDENPRRDTSAEALAKLKPAFQPDGGTVTAGQRARHHRWRGGARDRRRGRARRRHAAGADRRLRAGRRRTGMALRGADPRRAPAHRAVGGSVDDFDLIEINEAFAAQVLADGNELGFDWDRVNVNGGAIALGHPIGASGARVLTTLIHALRARGGAQGPRDPLPRRRGSGGDGGRARLTRGGPSVPVTGRTAALDLETVRDLACLRQDNERA